METYVAEPGSSLGGARRRGVRVGAPGILQSDNRQKSSGQPHQIKFG